MNINYFIRTDLDLITLSEWKNYFNYIYSFDGPIENPQIFAKGIKMLLAPKGQVQIGWSDTIYNQEEKPTPENIINAFQAEGFHVDVEEHIHEFAFDNYIPFLQFLSNTLTTIHVTKKTICNLPRWRQEELILEIIDDHLMNEPEYQINNITSYPIILPVQYTILTCHL